MTLRDARAGFERVLEIVVIALVLALTGLVIAGAAFRYAGNSLSWYDELASIGLVWLTYYGSALAALRGAHIGVPGLVNLLPPAGRVVAILFAEGMVLLFFVLLAVLGWNVLVILEGEHMVSLPAVPLQLTQSAIPIGAVLFIVAEALRLPETLRDARGGGFVDVEIKEAIALAQQADPTAGSANAGEPR